MFKVIATDVVISKGYDGAPALKFTESGESVRFRIGKKVYPPDTAFICEIRRNKIWHHAAHR